MKTTKVIFSLIMIFIFIDFISYLPASIKHLTNGGNDAINWICKMLVIVAMFGMGLVFYQLQKQFSKIGYVAMKSAFWLKILGFLCLFLAIISSVQNATNILLSNEIVENQLFIFTRAFLAHLLVRTPIQILFSLFLFLFSSFVEKASIVKQENESFI
jgi:hypothetical protein